MWVILLLPALMILLGVGLLLGGSDERKRIALAPKAVCAQIPAGHEVKLSGRAVAGETLIAPLSKEPCAFYRLIFLQWQRDKWGRSASKELVEVFRMQQAAEGFSIADATGKVALDADGVDLRVKKAFSGSNGLLGANEVDAVIALHLPGKPAEVRTTVNELIIPVGAPLVAIGEPVVTKGVTQFGGKRLLLSVLPEAELLKRDRGDAAGFALIAFGAAGLVGTIVALLR